MGRGWCEESECVRGGVGGGEREMRREVREGEVGVRCGKVRECVEGVEGDEGMSLGWWNC